MSTRINQYRAAVVASLKAIMPNLRSCEEQFGRFDLEELEKTVIAAPAVRFAVLDGTMKPTATEQVDAALRCAAFIITEGKDRDTAGWAIGEAIAVTAKVGQRWDMTGVSGITDVKLAPVISANLKQRGVSIMAVEWRQDLMRLGTDIFDDQGRLLEELYINDELVDASQEVPDA